MSRIFPDISTPSNVDVEITTLCNEKCRHCYNFWRQDDAPKHTIMSRETADRVIDEIIANRVFHVVLTGGECLTNYGVLTHFMKRLHKNNVSFSMNSNLLLATQEKMDELASLGLPHILTSLNSYIPEVNDKMVSREGAFDKVNRGIAYAVQAGIRVSVNMITTQLNKNHVYDTGLLLADLGVTNMFTTRMVPCTIADPELDRELQLSPGEQKTLILDEAIRVKESTGINIGSLIQYPVCFLGDVEKYRDYVGRGCPAGRKMLCLNADGTTQACLHESRGYGNIFRDGLKKCWENMKMWRDDSLLPVQCMGCDWIELCEGACRVYTNNLNELDFLATDNKNLPSPDILDNGYAELLMEKVFYVPKRLRWRKEDGFYLVSVRGASVYDVKDEIAHFLQLCQKECTSFGISEFPGSEEELSSLIKYWIVETTDKSTLEPVSTGLARRSSL